MQEGRRTASIQQQQKNELRKKCQVCVRGLRRDNS